jgi:hypothetical protein
MVCFLTHCLPRLDVFVMNNYNKFNNCLEECPVLLPSENNAVVVKMRLRGYQLTFLIMEFVKCIM